MTFVPRSFRTAMPSIRDALTTPGAELGAESLFTTFATSGVVYPGQAAAGFRERQGTLGFNLLELGAASLGGGNRELVLLQRQYNTHPLLVANLTGTVAAAATTVNVGLGGLPERCTVQGNASVNGRLLELRDPHPLWFSGEDNPQFRAVLYARLTEGGKWLVKEKVRLLLHELQPELARQNPTAGATLANLLGSLGDIATQLTQAVGALADDPAKAGANLLQYMRGGFGLVTSRITERLQGTWRAWVNPGTAQLIEALELVIKSNAFPGRAGQLGANLFDLRCQVATPLWTGARLSLAELIAYLGQLGYVQHDPTSPTLAPWTYWSNGSECHITAEASLGHAPQASLRVIFTTGDGGLAISAGAMNRATMVAGIWLFPLGPAVNVIFPVQAPTIDSYLSMQGASAGGSVSLAGQLDASLGAGAVGAGARALASGTTYQLQVGESPWAGTVPSAITQDTAITYLQAAASAQVGEAGGSTTLTNALRYRSAVAFWAPPGAGGPDRLPVETGFSGLSFGLSVPVGQLDALINGTDANALASSADALKLNAPWLQWALGQLLGSSPGAARDWETALGVQTVLLESAWAAPEGTCVTLATPSPPVRVQPFLNQWLAAFNAPQGGYQFAGLYVRYRVADALGAAGGRFQLGTFLGTPGITLQDVGVAGYESTVELGWVGQAGTASAAGGDAPPQIPPVILLCQ
jgi:hypothetical protein